MRRCRLLHAGGMMTISPLVLECIREIQREREPDVKAMLATEDWAAGRFWLVVGAYRARRRRQRWAR